MDDKDQRDRERHENSKDKTGRVATPPVQVQAADLDLGIVGCDAAQIRLLAQIRNAQAPAASYSAMIRVACRIPLWKISV